MYTYEDVKQAYAAIIEVGKANVKGSCGMFGAFYANQQHRRNLKSLEGNAKELYAKLMEDKSINY